jgi:hypothetical protein
MDGILILDNTKKLNIEYYRSIFSYIIKMTTQYIIKFKSIVNDDNCFRERESVDGFVELSEHKTSRMTIPTITVKTCENANNEKNNTLLYKHITNKFAEVDFNDSTRICSITYNDGYRQNTTYTSTLMFDENSASAYSDFKKNFEALLNSKYETEHYSNGKIMYIGEILYVKDENEVITNRVPSGNGTLHFNSFKNTVKYDGEFDDGVYDGGGTFYNIDGKITITALNISNGIPTQKGKLNINYTCKNEVIDINFSELWEKLKLTNKEQRKNYVMNDNFVNEVTKLYWQKDDLSFNELTFIVKPISEQITELWKETIKLRGDLHSERLKYQIQIDNNYKMILNVIIITFSANLLMHFVRGTIC